ncbi:hypothetical protein JCM17380_03700 [Desulfosporosinus burensis]
MGDIKRICQKSIELSILIGLMGLCYKGSIWGKAYSIKMSISCGRMIRVLNGVKLEEI